MHDGYNHIYYIVSGLITAHYIIKYSERNEKSILLNQYQNILDRYNENKFLSCGCKYLLRQKINKTIREFINLGCITSKEVLLNHNYICADCKTYKNLEVHHITYIGWKYELLKM